MDAEKHCQHRHPNSHLVAIETQSELDYIIMYRKYNAGNYAPNYSFLLKLNLLHGSYFFLCGYVKCEYSEYQNFDQLISVLVG